MLLELEVKGFALVDHLVLEFGAGLTALTGETGAGKSIILDSLTFLLGSAPKGDAQEACRVAGRFRPTQTVNDYLVEQGLPVEADELLILRERKEGGRTTSRLNGSIVSVNQLKSLATLLVDMHGQHQSYGLTRPATHLPMLDRLAGETQARTLKRYQEHYEELLVLRREIAETRKQERDRLREIEWLRLELDEIQKIEPRSGELLQLEAEIKKMAASEDLSEGAADVVGQLGREGGVMDGLAETLSALRPMIKADESLEAMAERLREAEIEIGEVLREMTEYAQEIQHNPGDLDRLQSRAEAIKTLCRKYGPTVDDVLEHRAKSAAKLDRLENSEEHLKELAAREAALLEKLEKEAGKLSKARRKAAAELGTELVSELSQLAMPKVAFQVEFQPTEDFGPDGKEQAQFLFSPNPGRPPSALSETASGGELSRVMLALVSIGSRSQERPTLVLDEIDTGLGGRTAEAVAAKLARLGGRVQVICVTHLPVVAAAATGHLVVEKTAGKSSTTISVREVRNAERVDEVARMLSGDASKKRARELAEELLA
ncbi:MAG: DNA repair protein RecN [Candidatus Eremiobacteraeota bacterium]|nr:DNA repair protein RecN [Candidatus Eremiobacteraeota bacterium]